MMLEFWNKISYMVQMLAACMIFMIPARKRTRFAIRVCMAAAVLLICSFLGEQYYEKLSEGMGMMVYWAFHMVMCVFFVWCGLSSSLSEAVYCTFYAGGMQHVAFDIYLIYEIAGGRSAVVTLLIYVAVYALFYYLFAKNLPEQGKFTISRQSLIPIATIFLLVWILSILENSAMPGFGGEMWNRIIYRIIDALCCVYVLWVQISQKEKMSLQKELAGINSAWRQQTKQYRMTSETIDSINRKCHDLKHQIRALRQITDEEEKKEFIHELEQDIMIYDTALNTGNKALDTVLMEKGLFCKNHGIHWSCMADGTKLDFMKVEDIYAVFGNALDNAVTAVMELEDPQKRVISVKMIYQNSLLMIQIQNYFDKKLYFESGLPVTTKKNKRDHGFGMKSIRYTVEKYNGTITVRSENHIFMLQILIPIAEQRG